MELVPREGPVQGEDEKGCEEANKEAVWDNLINWLLEQANGSLYTMITIRTIIQSKVRRPIGA